MYSRSPTHDEDMTSDGSGAAANDSVLLARRLVLGILLFIYSIIFSDGKLYPPVCATVRVFFACVLVYELGICEKCNVL